MSGVTETGFVVATEAELFAAMEVEARANISPTLDTAPGSVFGQVIGIVASKHAELYEVLEAVWGALSESATGAALDRIAALTGTTRRLNETDAALRIRRRQELSDQGATTEGAMRAALSKLTGMQAARVVSNRTMVTDSAGRPPKSVEAVVLGTATEASVAAAIWANLAAGIEAHGTTTTSITDSEGHSQPIKYSIATAQNLYLRITFKADPASYAGDAVLRARLRDFTSGALTFATEDGLTIAGGVDIGDTIYASRVAAAALTVPGVVAVSQVQMRAVEADPWQIGDFALGPRGYLGTGGVRGFSLDHIEVVRT